MSAPGVESAAGRAATGTLPPVNALQLFDEMLRTQVAPGLRALGLRGSGKNFSLPNGNGDHALLGFQKDKWNTAEVCRFTANTAFHSQQGWQQARTREPWLPASPTPHDMAPRGWQQRVGFLLDPPHDHWWTIRIADDVAAIADHVVAVVREAVLPQLRARLAGTEPPPLPGTGDETALDCPWPYCTDVLDLYLDGVDLDAAGRLGAEGFGATALDAAQEEVLERACTVAVPRARAWKVLHISRRRLDTYADRIGAGPALTFEQLLAVSLLGTDELLAAARWPDAASAVAAWAARLPDADPEAALVVAEDAVAVLPLPQALTLDDPAFGVSVVQQLMGATKHLLEELSIAGAV